MRAVHDLSTLPWQVAGCVPFQWESARAFETGAAPSFEIAPVPARLPGSVQGALRDAGIIPDWNAGVNHRSCEWVENRHWVYTAILPAAWFAGKARARLLVEGFDGNGRVFWNGCCAGIFDNPHLPYSFELEIPGTPRAADADAILAIVFETPPRWLGQFGRTSQIREWKTRFGYGWDWLTRLVQIGVCESIRLDTLDRADTPRFESYRCYTEYDPATRHGTVFAQGDAPDARAIRLRLGGLEKTFSPCELTEGIRWDVGEVGAWWPQGSGLPTLHTLTAEALGESGDVRDTFVRNVGFRRVEWRACEGAPPGTDPWLCVVNGEPVFLQGVNWTPIQCNFADATDAETETRVNLWRDAGINTFRVWAGAVIEREAFYDACDRAGIFVWQDLPLSSSALDQHPPGDDESFTGTFCQIARSCAGRRQHHASLLLWCGGNELQASREDAPGYGKPLDETHPLLRRAGEVLRETDPTRRFLPTSSSGPRFYALPENYGKGEHWDVHGPWSLGGMTMDEWRGYWERDDALFRSETGAPGASSPELIARYAGGMDLLPVSPGNPFWRRMPWWIESDAFAREHEGRAPATLAEYCEWSRKRQAKALVVAFRSAKSRFPRCGGFLFWMGHDTFPCCANTAIMEFDGTPKPALDALRPLFGS